MKKNYSALRTIAIFKCIITLKNGMHRVLRLTIDKVAQMNAAVRQVKQFGMLHERYQRFMKSLNINPYQVDGCKFVNERTGEVLLSL